MVQVTRVCDFTNPFGTIGTKRLPQQQQKLPFSTSQNCPRSENGSIRLPKVLTGSNGLPRVQVQFGIAGTGAAPGALSRRAHRRRREPAHGQIEVLL